MTKSTRSGHRTGHDHINTNIGLCVKACGGNRSEAVVLMTIVELSGHGARRAAFTRESLAERCGIPRSTIGNYLNALRIRDLIETWLAAGPDCDSHSICIWADLTDKAREVLHIPGQGS